MNRSAKGGKRSSLHYGGEGVLIHPPYQGVCGRHGTEEPHVTSGGLAESAGCPAVSKPISLKAKWRVMLLPVVGRLQRYHKRGESRVTEPIGDRNGSGKAAGVRRLGRERKPEEQGREGGTVPWGKTRTFSIEDTGGLAQPGGRKEGPFFGGSGRGLGTGSTLFLPLWPATARRRESCMRENCTCSLSGGRRLAP
jgi:hypothetical protein